MNIQSKSPSLTRRLARKPQSPKESPTLSSGSLGADLVFTAVGAVPVLGAGLNFLSGMESSFNGREMSTNISVAGAFSNLAGSASLVGGLALGNQTAIYAGLGMLGVSSLAVGYSIAAG